MYEAVSHAKLLGLAAVFVEQVDDKWAPLVGACHKVSILHKQIASAHRLRSESIKQCYFGARGNAYYIFKWLKQIRIHKKIVFIK